ncbi:MAG: orotate phosphoribosyltransferase [Bdellovibrionota bacterium]
MSLKPYQQNFITFLLASDVLKFGDFTTKSGRKTPYFINAGNFDTGRKIAALGMFYAEHIQESGFGAVDIIFGPAYKGVPLAVAAATALTERSGRDIGFSFDRKEVKDHGEGGFLVGKNIQAGDKVVIVEDVITAGTTLKKMTPILRDNTKANLLGVILAVDRCEKGAGEKAALNEVEESLNLAIKPIVNIHGIVEYLSSNNESGIKLTEQQLDKIQAYLEEYGA